MAAAEAPGLQRPRSRRWTRGRRKRCVGAEWRWRGPPERRPGRGPQPMATGSARRRDRRWRRDFRSAASSPALAARYIVNAASRPAAAVRWARRWAPRATVASVAARPSTASSPAEPVRRWTGRPRLAPGSSSVARVDIVESRGGRQRLHQHGTHRPTPAAWRRAVEPSKRSSPTGSCGAQRSPRPWRPRAAQRRIQGRAVPACVAWATVSSPAAAVRWPEQRRCWLRPCAGQAAPRRERRPPSARSGAASRLAPAAAALTSAASRQMPPHRVAPRDGEHVHPGRGRTRRPSPRRGRRWPRRP